MLQTPAFSNVKVVLAVPVPTAQVVALLDVNVTGKFDDAVALTVMGESPSEAGFSAAKLMVCASLLIVNDCVTCGAAAYVASPTCVARNVQRPAAIKVITVPFVPVAVHIVVVIDVTVTGNPDEAVGLTLSGGVSMVCGNIAGNVMPWSTLVIANERVILGAGLYTPSPA
jgi:hypothetical protein